jgi:transcriptional regulator with XRE-family HTH domain
VATDADVPLCQRIERARLRRGLSRRALGDLVGRSAEWIRQVERGDRPVDRLSILLQLASVLKVTDQSTFLRGVPGFSPPSPAAPVEAAVGELRAAIYRLPDGSDIEVTDLDRRVRDAWAGWQDSERPYAGTLSRLPVILRAPGGRHLAHAYRLAAVILGHLGEAPTALLAAQRAVTAAQVAGCPSTVAVASATYADTLVRLGEPVEAESLCRRAIQAYEPIDAASALLHLSAARAATEANAPQAALAWLNGAGHIDGTDPPYAFCSLDVDLQAVQIALRLGSLHDAVRLAGRLDLAGLPARVPRSRGYLTMASVHARAHNPSAVLYALGKAERACAEELRYNTEARRIIADLLAADNALIRADVLALAARAGLA